VKTDFALAGYNLDGTLNTDFNGTGQVTLDLGGRDEARAVVHFDGTLDPTFGAGGTAIADFAGRADWANGVAIEGNRKIVLAGLATVPDIDNSDQRDFGLARFTADGAPDLPFGQDGKITADFATELVLEGISEDEARAVALDPKGKIVVDAVQCFDLLMSPR
jgi:uncharacterized delta-60 repeat protein